MSWIRDKVRKDIQEEYILLVEAETVMEEDGHNKTVSSFTQSLRKATVKDDNIETLQNKCSLPIIKKKIKLL